jgi:PAS domain S-box-containing protein
MSLKNSIAKGTSEERYQLLVESVKDYAIIFLDPDGKVALWNVGAERLIGYTAKEVIGKHFSIFYPEEAKKIHYPEYELEQARKKGHFEDEGIRIRKKGSTFIANVLITPIYHNHELIGYSKITRDLTEKKEAEERLRRSEERYRLLIEEVEDYAIFMLDPHGYITSWNEGAKRLKGYTEKEILGKHFSIFYPEEKKRSGFPDYELEQAKINGRFVNEGLRVKKDGSFFYANVTITALYNSKNQLLGFSKITRDLTEKKKAEEELNQLNALLELKVKERTNELSQTILELQRTNSDLDNFIYTASHDLKAPVSNIEGLIETLKAALQEHQIFIEEIETITEMISDSVKRFQATIRDLTEINQSQRRGNENLIKVDLKELVDETSISISHLVKESGAEISIDQKGNEFWFSKVHIKSIFYNLLSNAIKYRSPKRQLRISVKSYSNNDYNILEVSDNGLGIKEEHTEKIFQMFKRMHAHVEGSGIGLYLVRRIVQNNGGKVEVESKEDQGSTFRIFLPISGLGTPESKLK